MRWLLTSPRRSVAPARRIREVRLPPRRSPRRGSRRRRRGRSSARRGPRPPGAPPGARAAARRRRRPRGASRSAGTSAAQRARIASVVAGSGVRSSAPSSAVPPSTTSLHARDDVDEPLRVGLVEQPLAHLGRRHADDLAAHRDQRRVARQLARAEARAVDHGVGVELVERGDVAALDRAAEGAQPSGQPRQVDDMSTTGATKRRPSGVRSQARGPRRATTGRARRRASSSVPAQHAHAAARHAGQRGQR